MSSMDLRSRYIRKFGRVPLHLNYKLLDVGDLGGRGVAGDRESMNAEGVGPGGLVQSVDFLVEFIDDLVFVSDFLTQGGILDDQGVHCLLDDVNLGKLGADGVQLGVELG